LNYSEFADILALKERICLELGEGGAAQCGVSYRFKYLSVFEAKFELLHGVNQGIIRFFFMEKLEAINLLTQSLKVNFSSFLLTYLSITYSCIKGKDNETHTYKNDS
jgi:hypothetical protein